ncbi:hypothetical protein NC652_039725 [Populus alba x Populus x berolinensis]|nr:hypothetical protein NC652_039725 [Populus alba x Populus x berolinensis]
MDFLNEKGQNILHVAAGSGQMKIVDEILGNRDLEALINEKDYDGNTPLHLAAMYCRSEIVQALVSDKRVGKRIFNNEELKPSGVVVKLLQGGRFEAPKSDGMREVLKVLVEEDDKNEFDNNLISDLPRTTLTTEELNRGVGNLLVVAVLVAGVTFAGAITVPGSGSDLSSARGLQEEGGGRNKDEEEEDQETESKPREPENERRAKRTEKAHEQNTAGERNTQNTPGGTN